MLQNAVEISIRNQQLLPAHQVTALQHAAGRAPFDPTLCQADESLWGGFWQFDVIAPGYTLPAVELALLRAVRLEGGWPEQTSTQQFLAELQAAAAHPLAGVWSGVLADAPLLIFAAPAAARQMTVVWYHPAGDRLLAGYRSAAARLHFGGLFLQRRAGFPLTSPPARPPAWLSRPPEEPAGANPLDRAILRHRRQLPQSGGR